MNTEPAPESWGGDDTLRGLLSNEIRRRWVLRGDANADRFADALLPVVTAWHEQRVAEIVARVKAIPTYKVITEDESLGYVVIAGDVLDALAADDRTGQR